MRPKNPNNPTEEEQIMIETLEALQNAVILDRLTTLKARYKSTGEVCWALAIITDLNTLELAVIGVLFPRTVKGSVYLEPFDKETIEVLE